MSSDTDKNSDTTKTRPAPRAPNGFEPIKVKELWFCQPNGRDLPLEGSNGGMAKVIAGHRSWGDDVTIQYEPWQRHHRVRCTAENGDLKIEFCIPEAWCLYVPVPDLKA